MNKIDFRQVYAAAKQAEALYPGPVGEILSQEIKAWAETTGRFGGHGRVGRLLDQLRDAAQNPR